MGESHSAGNTSPVLLENPKPQVAGRILRSKESWLAVDYSINQTFCILGNVFRDYWSSEVLNRMFDTAR